MLNVLMAAGISLKKHILAQEKSWAFCVTRQTTTMRKIRYSFLLKHISYFSHSSSLPNKYFADKII